MGQREAHRKELRGTFRAFRPTASARPSSPRRPTLPPPGRASKRLVLRVVRWRGRSRSGACGPLGLVHPAAAAAPPGGARPPGWLRPAACSSSQARFSAQSSSMPWALCRPHYLPLLKHQNRVAEEKAPGVEAVPSWNATSIIILSFNKHLWNTYYESGTELQAGNPRKQGRHKTPRSLQLNRSSRSYI